MALVDVDIGVDTDRRDGSRKLNYDILAFLFQFLRDTREVSCLMRTCQPLYQSGIPHLLNCPITLEFHPFIITPSSPVRNRPERKISSFTNFVLAPGPLRRTSCLRDITISHDSGTLSQETFNKLLEVLRRATHLRKFSKEHDDWSSGAAMLEALAANESIQTLQCMALGRRMLQTWRAPLERAHFRLSDDSVEGNSSLAVRTFSATLQELTIKSIMEFRPAPGILFPYLKKLTLSGLRSPLAHVRDIIYACPNLLHFSICPQMRSLTMRGEEEVRQVNLQENMKHCWDSLDVVEGPVEHVYALALPCKIRHLRLSMNDRGLENPPISLSHTMLNVLLGVTKFSRVSLEIRFSQPSSRIQLSWGLQDDSNTEDCLPLTPEDAFAAGGLGKWDYGQLLQVIDTYSEILSRCCPLDYLKLVISSDRLQWSVGIVGQETIQSVNTPIESTELYHRKYGIAVTIALHIAQHIPVLNKLELELPFKYTYRWDLLMGPQGQRRLCSTLYGHIVDIPALQ